MRINQAVMIVIAGAALTGVLAVAGPLSPPPGPVAPTAPSLADIQAMLAVPGAPDTASAPGSAIDGRPWPAPGAMRVGFVDDAPVAGLWTIADIAGSVEVIEFRDGAGGASIPLAGFTKLPAVTLIRPLSPDLSAANWFETVAAGDLASARTSATLVFYTQAGEPVAQWLLTECWPHAYDIRIDGLEAAEQVTITMEALQRIR